MSNIYRLYALLALPFVFIGCGVRQGNQVQSPYADFYRKQFMGVELPSTTAIRSVGNTFAFSEPADKVWGTIIQVIKQYEGIIAMETTNKLDRRVLFVHGLEVAIVAHKVVSSNFLGAWIALAVSPAKDSRGTEISAAWVSPNTTKATSVELSENDDVTEDLAVSDKTTTRAFTSGSAIHGFDEIAAALSEERMNIAVRLSHAEKPERAMKLVPQAVINEFFYHIATQLYGPERWREKYLDTCTFHKGPLKRNVNIERADDGQYDKYEKEVRSSGNWVSAKISDSYLVVHCPRVENLLTEIIDRLKQAAGGQHRDTTIYIIASPDINAYSLPNGDIFVCTGLMEALDSVDELAAVLAHELDHYLQHDTCNRLVAMEKARKAHEAISKIGKVLGMFGGMFTGGLSQAVSSGVSTSSQITSSVISNTVSRMTWMLGESVASTIVTGYNSEIELRADSNGARYLWAAGFDVDAELELLHKLKDIRVEATKRSEPIASGLINAQPGIEERTKRLIETIAQLKSEESADRNVLR